MFFVTVFVCLSVCVFSKGFVNVMLCRGLHRKTPPDFGHIVISIALAMATRGGVSFQSQGIVYIIQIHHQVYYCLL